MTGYIRDGAEIYRRSFAIIRREPTLAGSRRMRNRWRVRIIHACGMVEAAADIVFSAGAVAAARAALAAGARPFCGDAKMVAHGLPERGCRATTR